MKNVPYLYHVLPFALFLSIFPMQTSAATEEPHTLRKNLETIVSTLDPTIAYDWANYHIVTQLTCNLTGFDIDTDNGNLLIKLDLATEHTISEDYLTHTFKLDKNRRFSNGRLITAEDVVFSFEHMMSPEVKSPGAAFFYTLAGGKDYHQGKTDRIDGIRALDAHTIEFRTLEPDATLRHKLTLNFAGILARESIPNSKKTPISCGAFNLESWENDTIVITAEDKHPQRAELYWKKIAFRTDVAPQKGITYIENGQADEQRSYINLEAKGGRSPQTHLTLLRPLGTSFIAMNQNLAPFNDVRVRKAINMALDKSQITDNYQVDATIAQQVLPPDFPAFEKGYQGYPYDQNGARTLLQEAGYPNGFTTELLLLDKKWIQGIGDNIRNQLAEIGVRVRLRSVPVDDFLLIAGDPEQAPMVFSEGVAWIADFPDPLNFFSPLLSTESHDGGWNWAFYSNPTVDQMGKEANSMARPQQDDLRLKKWQTLYRAVMEDAPWVPMYNNINYLIRAKDVVSKTEHTLPFTLNWFYHYTYRETPGGTK